MTQKYAQSSNSTLVLPVCHYDSVVLHLLCVTLDSKHRWPRRNNCVMTRNPCWGRFFKYLQLERLEACCFALDESVKRTTKFICSHFHVAIITIVATAYTYNKHRYGFKVQYSVILTTSLYDINPQILIKKGYFQNFSWFWFCAWLCTLALLHRLGLLC